MFLVILFHYFSLTNFCWMLVEGNRAWKLLDFLAIICQAILWLMFAQNIMRVCVCVYLLQGSICTCWSFKHSRGTIWIFVFTHLSVGVSTNNRRAHPALECSNLFFILLAMNNNMLCWQHIRSLCIRFFFSPHFPSVSYYTLLLHQGCQELMKSNLHFLMRDAFRKIYKSLKGILRQLIFYSLSACPAIFVAIWATTKSIILRYEVEPIVQVKYILTIQIQSTNVFNVNLPSARHRMRLDARVRDRLDLPGTRGRMFDRQFNIPHSDYVGEYLNYFSV